MNCDFPGEPATLAGIFVGNQPDDHVGRKQFVDLVLKQGYNQWLMRLPRIFLFDLFAGITGIALVGVLIRLLGEFQIGGVEGNATRYGVIGIWASLQVGIGIATTASLLFRTGLSWLRSPTLGTLNLLLLPIQGSLWILLLVSGGISPISQLFLFVWSIVWSVASLADLLLAVITKKPNLLRYMGDIAALVFSWPVLAIFNGTFGK